MPADICRSSLEVQTPAGKAEQANARVSVCSAGALEPWGPWGPWMSMLTLVGSSFSLVQDCDFKISRQYVQTCLILGSQMLWTTFWNNWIPSSVPCSPAQNHFATQAELSRGDLHRKKDGMLPSPKPAPHSTEFLFSDYLESHESCKLGAPCGVFPTTSLSRIADGLTGESKNAESPYSTLR